jgi:hypothetical protein
MRLHGQVPQRQRQRQRPGAAAATRLAHALGICAALFGFAGVDGFDASEAEAQETGGVISGTVSDDQKAALPGVLITLKNDGTNAVTTTTTNGEGRYTLPFVSIGRYTLTAALDGFASAKQTEIEVRVGDRLRFDLTLPVGAVTESVNVTSATPVLETGSAQRGQVITREQVQDLPLLGRNPFALAVLSPGVQYTPALQSRSNRPFDNGGMDNFSINGGRAFTNEFLLDGVPNSNTESDQPNNLSFVPSPDATAEFKVQTSIYDAQYGRTGGGVVNVILKSGTNQFHGALYEYYRDDKLNANTFDANRLGQAKAGLYWNQPGATLDGPVKIPGLYDGTDKTFFMYNWEQIRSEVPFPQVWTVPTAAERAGDFSQTRTSDGRPITVYDPLTTRLENGRYVRDPFPNNRIPADRLNPVALNLLQRVPLPNTTGQVNNYLAPETSRADKYDQHVAKVDQVLNTNHRFFVRLARNRRTEINDYGGFAPEASPFYTHGRTNTGLSTEVTSVLSPSLVLSSKAGFIRHNFYIARFGDGFNSADLGFPQGLVSQLPRMFFPEVRLSGYSTYGTQGSQFNVSDTYSISETFSKISGRHAVKFGGEFRSLLNDQQQPTSSLGFFQFTPGYTQQDAQRADAAAGSSMATFLLGYPSATATDGTTISGVPNNPRLKYRSNYTALFLQDDWRVSDKLTINAGLRWDYESPLTEAENKMNVGFDPNAASTFSAPGLSLKGGLLFASDGNRLPFKRDLNNIQPRIGAAYQLNDLTVLRGGYALAYLPTFDIGYSNGFSVQTPVVSSVDGGITPAVTLSNPYPNGLDQPVGSSLGLSTMVGRAFTFADSGRTIPSVHQFSAGLQRQLPGRLVLDASYAASRTRGIVVSKGINEITAAQLAQGNAMLAATTNPFQGLLPGTPYNGATVPLQQLLRPYPQFGAITEAKRPLGTTDYDALQVSVNKRMAKGVQFLVSYTYSRQMEEVAYLNAQDSWDQLLRVVAERDAPHRLMVSGSWQLPFFAGKGGLLAGALGGWQLNAIVTAQSGLPVTLAAGAVPTGVDPSLANPTRDRWFNTCTQTLAGGRQNCASADEPVAWQVQAPFTLRTQPTRSDAIRTTRPTLVDFSIFKQFSLPSRVRLQVRLESFNLFNTPWFGGTGGGSPGPNTDVNNAAFGTVAATQQNDPRNIQVGVRLTF